MFTASFTRDQRRCRARCGRAPEGTAAARTDVEDLPESVMEMIWSAERKLETDPEAALEIIQKVCRNNRTIPKRRRCCLRRRDVCQTRLPDE
jgi:hypothetical protein